MTAAILLGWILSGILAARVTSADHAWWRWAPVSMYLGPLWLTVAAEQRRHHAADPIHGL